MSPSMMPTRPPHFASAMARFTATVVLPTPPLPAPTAMMFLTPSTGARPASGALTARTLAVISTSTAFTPGSAMTAACACSRICSLTGTGGGGELDGERHAIAVDAKLLDEPERHDVLVEVRIVDDLQGVEDGCFCNHGLSTMDFDYRL